MHLTQTHVHTTPIQDPKLKHALDEERAIHAVHREQWERGRREHEVLVEALAAEIELGKQQGKAMQGCGLRCVCLCVGLALSLLGLASYNWHSINL